MKRPLPPVSLPSAPVASCSLRLGRLRVRSLPVASHPCSARSVALKFPVPPTGFLGARSEFYSLSGGLARSIASGRCPALNREAVDLAKRRIDCKVHNNMEACRQKAPPKVSNTSKVAARFAAVFPPSNTPLSLALQNYEEAVYFEGGKPALITLLNSNSPPGIWKHHKGVGRVQCLVPLLEFAILTGTYKTCSSPRSLLSFIRRTIPLLES